MTGVRCAPSLKLTLTRKLTLVAAFVAPALLIAQSQTTSRVTSSPYVLGERIRQRSTVLGESREVIVTLPPSSAGGNGKYPVVYVLDGDEYATIATTSIRALASSARMPESIVVAIVNSDRKRDLTPTLARTSELPPGISRAGGADAFLEYVSRELVPMINGRYRAQPLRVVVGHSLGGLLAVRALAATPTLFRRYVLIDPSLW